MGKVKTRRDTLKVTHAELIIQGRELNNIFSPKSFTSRQVLPVINRNNFKTIGCMQKSINASGIGRVLKEPAEGQRDRTKPSVHLFVCAFVRM